MQETMGELLAMTEDMLWHRLEHALMDRPGGPDPATRKQAIIAALSVLLGEPRRETPLADMMERAARKARQDGN